MLFRPLVEKFIGTIIRVALAALGGYLIRGELVSSADWTKFADDALLVLVPIVWGLYQKYSSHLAKEVAKQLPAGTTNDEVKTTIREMPTTERVSLAFTSELR